MVAVSWLNPFSPGPSPAVVPWIVGAACALAVWTLALIRNGGLACCPPRAGILCALALWTAAGLPHGAPGPALAGLCVGLLVVLFATGAATAWQAAWPRGLLLAAVVSAVLGLLQAFGAAAALWPWVSAAQPGEAYANLRQPNQFGSLCWLGVAVLLWGRPRLPVATAVGVALLLGIAAAASASRTAVLQALLTGALAVAWPGPSRRAALRLWAVAAGAHLLAVLVLPGWIEAWTGQPPARALLERLADGPEGCGSRRVLWDNVLHLIAQRPWTGWGWGELDYAHFWTLYPGPRFCDILDNAHNLPLHLAVELGVPVALLAAAGVLAWVLRQQPWREQVPSRRLAWALLAVIGLHSLLEYPLWYAPFQLAAGLALGTLLARGPARRPATGRGRAAGWLVAGAAAAALAWTAWDYARVSQAYLPAAQRWPSMRQDPAGQMAGSWLFGRQARFAQLWVAQPTAADAAQLYPLALELLHYSPEPRVVEQAIAAARLLGREDEAQALALRAQAAFAPQPEARAGAAAQR